MSGTFKALIGAVALVIFLFVGLTDTGLNEMLDPDRLKPTTSDNKVIEEPAGEKEEANNDNTDSSMKEYGLSRVVDGDTILVLDDNGEEHRVRLLLIDTPESVHPNGLIEEYGVEASDYAKEYFKGVRKVKLDIGEEELDKYDRLLAHVFVDGENFNLHMVEKGYARVAYVSEPNTKFIDEFKEAEKRAKKDKLNIWSIDGYVTGEGFDMSVVDEDYPEAG